MILLELFLTFLKIGAVSFGGGYAMIPLVTDEVVSHAWMTSEEVMNFIAVAESTPGPIAINMATFIGSCKAGILGSLVATLGIVLPSFIIILIIATIIKGLLKFAGVNAFLLGIRPVAVSLIIGTAISMILTVIFSVETVYSNINFDYKALVIFALVVGTHFLVKKLKKKAPSPILLIVFSALLGMFFYGVL